MNDYNVSLTIRNTRIVRRVSYLQNKEEPILEIKESDSEKSVSRSNQSNFRYLESQNLNINQWQSTCRNTNVKIDEPVNEIKTHDIQDNIKVLQEFVEKQINIINKAIYLINQKNGTGLKSWFKQKLGMNNKSAVVESLKKIINQYVDIDIKLGLFKRLSEKDTTKEVIQFRDEPMTMNILLSKICNTNKELSQLKNDTQENYLAKKHARTIMKTKFYWPSKKNSTTVKKAFDELNNKLEKHILCHQKASPSILW